MVQLSEVHSMFWGISLDGGKRYSQTVERAFHISMAALEPSTIKDGDQPWVSVMIQAQDKQEFLLCTLEKGRVMQQTLDLNFNDGEEVTFFLNGKGVVHLTGYLIEDDEPGFGEEESDDEEVPQLVGSRAVDSDSDEEDSDDDEEYYTGKRKKKQKQIVAMKKARRMMEDDDSEDDDDDDDDSYSDLDDFIDDEAIEDSDEEDDDDSFLDDDIDDDVVEEALARMSSRLTAGKSSKDKDTPGKKKKTEVLQNGHSPKKNKKDTPSKKKDQLTAIKNKDTPAKQNKDSPSKKAKDTPKEKVKDTPQKNKDTPQINELATPQSDTPSKKKKKKNKNKQSPGTPGGENQQQQSPSTSSQELTPDTSSSAKKKKKKKKKAKDNDQAKNTPVKAQTPGKAAKKVLEGGLICEESKEGHGPIAKPGKTVQVYYTGRLPNGKIFDSTTKGTPFKFKLGKNEVIRGWDVGLDGMKVGSKRKLTIPAKMGYGNQRMGEIPANSTLTFDVELKAVS